MTCETWHVAMPQWHETDDTDCWTLSLNSRSLALMVTVATSIWRFFGIRMTEWVILENTAENTIFNNDLAIHWPCSTPIRVSWLLCLHDKHIKPQQSADPYLFAAFGENCWTKFFILSVSVHQWMNYKVVCRTAPAIPSLSIPCLCFGFLTFIV